MGIERYSRALQIELGMSLSGRRKIYLDTRFWIILRDSALGFEVEPAACRLLDDLRRGVASGFIICPISASTFLELMTQPFTPTRRIGTAALVDELSLGIAMVPSDVLMGTEIYSFLLRTLGEPDLHPIKDLIWTKIACVFGNTYPSLPKLSPADELAVHQTFF